MADITSEGLGRIYGNGETMRRFEEQRQRAGAARVYAGTSTATRFDVMLDVADSLDDGEGQ